ncbi:MAG TPA: hypothetical protein PKO06_01565 [Candidatus Ozemobacteraceae bacterium]|nr:hypothetical protein [Candidatus Ozemobacteraceae bacterium]
MNSIIQRAGMFLLALLLVLPITADAWGPMTHLTVNQRAYEQAVREIGNQLAIPRELADDFIGGGPCPDIKSQGGASFPRDFHGDPDTVVRMIELAKQDPKFGQADVVMALGWAGHVFGEVWTAHAEDGYANNKVTIPVEKSAGINHQINELCLDVLMYHRNRESLKRKHLSIPIRLLEAAMIKEQENKPELPRMSAAEIKTISSKFLPTVVGIRVIAEYLMRERPDLLDEMHQFFSDSEEQIDGSVQQVVRLLKEHGLRTSKTKTKSLDSSEKVKLVLEGSFSNKFKTWAFSALGRVLQSDGANDIFTVLGYRLVKGALFTPAFHDPFLDKAKTMGAASVWGNPNHSRIVTRFTEALLSRGDLTFPEIIAYAMEGFEPGTAEKQKQQSQFKQAGLNASGRKPVSSAQVLEALQEVERVEALQREWPWFWPWRPSDLRVAQTREQAGRLLTNYFEDTGVSGSLGSRLQSFKQQNQQLRGAIWSYRMTAWYQPFKKWDQMKSLSALSDTYAADKSFFAEVLRVQTQLAAQGNDPARLAGMKAETEQRLRETENALRNAKAQLEQLPIWSLIKRDRKKDEIKKIEQQLADLKSRLEVLQALGETSPSTASSTTPASAPQASVVDLELGRNYTLAEAQKEYESAYAAYAALAAHQLQDTPAVKAALEKLDQARRVRESVIARLEAEKAAGY